MFITFLYSLSGSHIFKVCPNEADLVYYAKTIGFFESMGTEFDLPKLLQDLGNETDLVYDYLQNIDELNGRNRKNLKSYNPIVLQIINSRGDTLSVSKFDPKFISEYINSDSLINKNAT